MLGNLLREVLKISYYNIPSIFELIFGVTDPDYRDGLDDIDPELERLDKADFELKQYYEDRIGG